LGAKQLQSATVVDAHRAIFESLGCIVKQAEPDFSSAEISFRTLRAWTDAANYGKMFVQHPDAFKDTLKDEIERGMKLMIGLVISGPVEMLVFDQI
jgi:amidase